MPRNEFLDHKEEEDDGNFELVVEYADGVPINIIKMPINHPGKGEDEGQDPEVAPVEDPEPTKLADLRGIPGGAITRSHLAED